MQQEASTDIEVALMDKLDLILQMQMQNEDHGEITRPQSEELVIENQNVYKTLQLVKNTLILEIFEKMHQLYINGDQSSMIAKCLS